MFDALLPFVHRFSLNAYDFEAPGPNAPFPWLRKTLDALTSAEKAKVLLGLPFYGYDNRGALRRVQGGGRADQTDREETDESGDDLVYLAWLVSVDAVTGPAYVDTLTKEDVKKIRWDASTRVRPTCCSVCTTPLSSLELLTSLPQCACNTHPGVLERVLLEARRRPSRHLLPVSPVPSRPTGAL